MDVNHGRYLLSIGNVMLQIWVDRVKGPILLKMIIEDRREEDTQKSSTYPKVIWIYLAYIGFTGQS